MGVKLGTLDISSFKVGSADCKVYLGETLLYSGDTPTPPTPTSYTWVDFDYNFSSSTPVYGLAFNGLMWDTSCSFAINLYDNPQATGNPIGYYEIFEDINTRTGSVLLAINNEAIVSRQYDDGGVPIEDFDGLVEFNTPFYLLNYDAAYERNCMWTQCNCEEECMEWDEETGECLYSQCPPECEECMEEETHLLASAKIIQQN